MDLLEMFKDECAQLLFFTLSAALKKVGPQDANFIYNLGVYASEGNNQAVFFLK